MIFEGDVPAWVTLVLLPIAFPILLALLLSGLVGFRMGCLALAGFIGIGLFTAMGIFFYLDSLGAPVTGEVLHKKESLVYHLDGSWERKMVAEVKYRASATAPAVTESLVLKPARFDEIHQGDFVQLRYCGPPNSLRILRLEDQRVFPQFWWWATEQAFLMFFAFGLLLVVVARVLLEIKRAMIFFLCGLVTVGSWWLASVIVPLITESASLMESVNSVSANVKELHPPYLEGWINTKLFSPYDLVLLDVLPLGRSEAILSVDTVDIGSLNVQPGQSLNVNYSASNPRHAIIPDASRSYFWKNALLRTLLALFALLIVARIAFLIREERQPDDPSVRRSRKRHYT